MTLSSITEIDVFNIQPSPYQHRRAFHESDLQELANSICRDGLIQPITVRPVNAHFELIAGERRWRAFKLAGLPTIPARVLDVDDLQARRLCATENLQRADLTSLEEVMALCELVDASLLEFSNEYAALTPIQEPKWRVKTLLTKLDSDDKNGTDFFRNKFVPKVIEIFSGLPKPKEWQSFQKHDLPLLFTHNEVQQFALDHRLNKSQTKAIDALQKADPQTFRELAANSETALEKIVALAAPPKPEPGASDIENPVAEPDPSPPEEVRDLSAATIHQAAKKVRETVAPAPTRPLLISDDEVQAMRQEKLEKDNYEALRAAFHNALNQLFYGAVIVYNPADCVDPTKWKGTWSAFERRYCHSIQEVRDRLTALQQRIPFIFELLESMRDE